MFLKCFRQTYAGIETVISTHDVSIYQAFDLSYFNFIKKLQ